MRCSAHVKRACVRACVRAHAHYVHVHHLLKLQDTLDAHSHWLYS